AERRGEDGPRAKLKSAGASKPTQQAARRQALAHRGVLAPLNTSVTKAEPEIERLSKKIATIESALADGTLYSGDAARAQALAPEGGETIRAPGTPQAAWRG